MAENIALPIAIVLVVGFLGSFVHIIRIFMVFSHSMHGHRYLVLRYPRLYCCCRSNQRKCGQLFIKYFLLFFFRKSRNEEKRAQKLTFEEHCDHHMKQIPRATAVTAQPCQLTSDRTTNHYTFQSFKGIRDTLYITVYKYHNYRKFSVRTSLNSVLKCGYGS